METQCNWPLGNGDQLTFDIIDKNEGWNPVAGLYIFTYQRNDGLWQPLYVGQTDNFSTRLPTHERLPEALRLGATHIHALVVAAQSNRDIWEQQLIQSLQPQLNIQHR